MINAANTSRGRSLDSGQETVLCRPTIPKCSKVQESQKTILGFCILDVKMLCHSAELLSELSAQIKGEDVYNF